MTAWILILTMFSSSGVSITTQKYSTEKYCQQAGEAAKEIAKGVWWSIRYTCTPA